MRDHYEGVGIHGTDITRAERILNSLFYNGEKKPYMWWTEFEKQLTWTFGAYDLYEGRKVYSDVMRLRTLLGKVNVDFLASQKASIDVELSKVPVIYTYSQALQCFREAVNKKFPPNLMQHNSSYRRGGRGIHNINTGRGGRGRGFSYGRGGRGRGFGYNRYQGRGHGQGRGYGFGGRNQSGRFGGRFGGRNYNRNNYGNNYGGRSNNWIEKTRNDSKIAMLADGRKLEIYPSMYVQDADMRLLKHEDYEWIMQGRQMNKRRMGQNYGREVQKISRPNPQYSDNNTTTASNQNEMSRAVVPYSRTVNFSGSIMGGRNEQAEQRQNTR